MNRWKTTVFVLIFLQQMVAGFAGASAIGILGISLGDEVDIILSHWGEPRDRYPSAYGYENWVYFDEERGFVQLGVVDAKVREIYSNSDQWSLQNVRVGTSLQQAVDELGIEPDIEFSLDVVTFHRQQDITAEEFLIKIFADGTLAQIHLDIQDGHRVTSLRLSQPDIYRVRWGSFGMTLSYPSNRRPSDPPELIGAQKQAYLAGEARTMFYAVNAVRQRFGLEPFAWMGELAAEAFGHSKDMVDTGFFSHDSPNTGDLGDRMRAAGLSFRSVAENIAAGQYDAVYATESLMNSESHRHNILREGLTGLGTGVYDQHYTQKFIALFPEDEDEFYSPLPL